jgi:predicted amidohydrolase
MVKIAGVQFSGHVDKEVNVQTAIRLARDAAGRRAKIICLPELFSTMYFCVETTRMTRYLWDLELRAHAIANIYYVCGVNKVGVDVGGSARDHHGASLIANPRGEIMAEASATQEAVVMADVDLSVIPELRALWGYYRDRRPDLYGPLVEVLDHAAAPVGRV